MKKSALLLALALSLPLPTIAGVLVTDIEGRVALDGQASTESVQLMAELGDGVTVKLDSGARLVAVDLNSGREYVFKAPGRYRIEKSGPRALDDGKVEILTLPASKLPVVKIATGRVAQATLVMRGHRKAPATQATTSPVNTAVLTTTPTLQWPENTETTETHVTLLDSTGRQIFQTTLRNTSTFAIPAEAKLQAGGRYGWQARAEQEGRPLAEYGGEFSVLASAEATRLKRFMPGTNAEFSRRALYAALLMEAGAKEEARKHWLELRAERPDDPALTKLAQP
jgi:hypothetical protein